MALRRSDALRRCAGVAHRAGIACAFAFTATLPSASAQAQIHRCEADGRVTYSDRPCETGAKATTRPYAATAPSGVLELDIRQRYYDVAAHDYPTLVRALAAKGPRGFHGMAGWKVSYHYTVDQQPSGCAVDSVRVRVAGEILMPRWTDAADGPRDLQRQWSDYIVALQRHEDGHIQHGREFALLVKERLMGLGRIRCDVLPTLAQREYDRLYANLRTRDQEYDARTGHGRTQGAYFTPP